MRPMRPVPVLLLVLLCLAFLPFSANADTRMLHLSFTANQQSMWGAGTAFGGFQHRYTIIDPNTVQFDVQTDNYPSYVGPHVTVDTFFWGDVDFGVFARARAAAHLGLFADVAVSNGGSIDVAYPLNTKLTFPDKNSFRAGDTVAITSEYDGTTVPTGWALNTTSPKGSFDLRGDFGLHLDAYAKGCIVACLDTTQVLGLPSPAVDVETGEFRIFKVDENSSISTPPILGQFTPWSGTIHTPNITTTASVDANQRSLKANGEDPFITISLDLGSVAEDLFHLPPLSFNTDDFGDFSAVSGVHFHYLIVGASANAHLKATQSFRFDPDPKVTFTFPEQLQYWINGGAPQTGATAEMRVGDTIHIVTSQQKDPPMPVTPTYRMDNQFHSETDLKLAEDVNVSAGSLGLQVPSITIIPQLCTPGGCVDLGLLGELCVPEICTPAVTFDPPDFDIGPLYDHTFPIAEQSLGTLVSGAWQLQGFTPATVDALELDPENPIIHVQQQTGIVRNLGSGKRLVPFVVDVSNPGDVALSQLSLQNSLQNAFATARSYSLDHVSSCDFTLDPAYNGNGSLEVLAAGNTLDVGKSKRLVIFSVVSPKPDPLPYTDQSNGSGRSPLTTLVTSSSSSQALLGPAHPTSASDFLFFGDQFVKFDATGNVFGTVGSNNSIEIKNGASGVVAGDLRAGRYIKVAGSVSADYAISGGAIDVVGKGALTLFGNMKPFQTMTPFTMTAPAFTPSTPLAGNVWVPLNGSMTLDPGYYGTVTVNSGGSLELHAGTYYVTQLFAESGSSVKFDAPVNVVVASDLEVGAGSSISGNGSSRDSVINALQTGDITTGAGSSIRATFIAPRSNLFFGASSTLEGSFFGRSITLNAGTTAKYHYDCDPLIDANCDGTPDCP